MRLLTPLSLTALAVLNQQFMLVSATAASAQEPELEPAPAPAPAPISLLLPPTTQSLHLETWKSQLNLLDTPLEPHVHWIYLSGRSQCNGTENVCESYDDAFAMGFHVLQSQQHGGADKRNKRSSSTPSAPPITISYIDCDSEPILCHSWLLRPPAIMHILVTPESARPGPGIKTPSTAAEDVGSTPVPEPEFIPILLRPIRLSPGNNSEIPNDLYSDVTPASARQRLIPIINGARPIESFHHWDGLMNPFTGKLGMRGWNTKWGWLTYNFGWVPLTWQTFMITVLALFRLAVWFGTPKVQVQDGGNGQPGASGGAGGGIESLFIRDGALGERADGDLPEGEGKGGGGAEGANQESKKDL